MKRFLKIVGILTLFATALAYFGFRILFFDPFEGSFGTLDAIIPRDVDFVLRRRNLDRDFRRFPEPDFYESLALRKEWRRFQVTALYRELAADLDLGARIESLEADLKSAEPLDVMNDLLGREVMVVGRYKEDGTLAVVGLVRASFRAKAAVEGLSIEAIRGLAGDQISSYEEVDGVAKLVAQGFEIHLFRRSDLIVAGTDPALVGEIRRLADGSGINLVDSPQYREVMARNSDSGRPLDFAVDLPEVARRQGWDQAMSDDSLASTILRFLPPSVLGLTAGRLFLGDRIELQASTVVNDMSAVQRDSAGLFSGNPGSLLDSYKFCGRVFPGNVFACGYLRVDIGAYLRYIEGSLTPDDRELLGEFVRMVRQRNPRLGVTTPAELLAVVASYLGNEVAIAFEPQSPYSIPGKEEINMPNKRWGPRMALASPVADKASLSQLVSNLVDAVNGGRGSQSVGTVYRWSFPGDVYTFQEVEFFDQEVPPLAMGFVDLEGKDYFVLTVTGQFMEEIIKVRLMLESKREDGLMATTAFKQAVDAVDGYGQGFMFCASPGLRNVLEDYMEVIAEDESRPDWDKLRPQTLDRLVAEEYPEYRRGGLPEEIRRQLDPRIDRELERYELEWRQTGLLQAIEERQRELEVCDLFHWAVLTYSVRERDIGLRLLLTSPATFP